MPGAPPDLAERVATRVALLPGPGDRTEFGLLLRLLDSRVVNFVLTGRPRPFSSLDTAQRERYLRAWSESRLLARRKAFQALKRLVTVVHYATPDGSGHNAAWAAIGYPGPLAPAPATPKPIRPLPVAGDVTLDCDVVVVGSGAGGAVVAAELAAAGRDVVVLEKGGYFNEADFSQREGEMLERLYDAAGLRATADLGVLVLQGSCLGGGTVVNYTTSFHTPEAVRTEWARAHGLRHFVSDEFARALDAVARRIGVTRDENAPSARDRVLVRGLRRLGWHHGLLPRDVRGCSQSDDCGYCGYGCRRGAKQSALLTFLQDACDRGARVVVGATARRVVLTQGRAVGVEANVGRAQLSVRAQAVVVACGSIHSPALLLRSGIRSPALGRHLALHPATAVFGLMDEEVRPWAGTVQAHYSDQFADLDRGYGFKFETAPLHPSLAALATAWESGAAFAERMRRLPHVSLVGILLRDRDGGRVRVDRYGAPVVEYRLSRYDAGHLRRGIAEAAAVLEAAGAREIWTPHTRWVAYRPADGPEARKRWLTRADTAGYRPNQLLLASFHQMGSCRMGTSPATSIVDPENRVWGVPGLYVADASTFPSASGVNPMLTIMAIAHRAGSIIRAS